EMKDQNVAIYDLGGGTFDVSIVNITNNEIKVLSTDGDSNLGGFDFDNAIVDHVINVVEDETGVDLYDDDDEMQELRENAEKCKRYLSRRAKNDMPDSLTENSINVENTNDILSSLI